MEKIIYKNGVPAFRIVKMQVVHIPEVLAIEKESFSMPWTENAFQAEVKNISGVSYAFVLTAFDESVAGYLCVWRVTDELHINNIAVAPNMRAQGLGLRLLEFAEELAHKLNCVSLALEVRPSNARAIQIYKKFGFFEAGRRKRYYEDTNEDAVLMAKRLE